jgi:two-component system response regulator NreC
MKTIKVIIVDDHQFLIDGIKLHLSDCDEIEIISESHNGQEILDNDLLEYCNVLILDLEMPVLNAFSAIPFIIKKAPDCKILVLTSYAEKSLVKKVFELGVKGYALKNITKENLIIAIKQLNGNETFLSDELQFTLINKDIDIDSIKQGASQPNLLSQRENEVLILIANGFSNKEIGEKLFLSAKTIDSHRTNLMKKIGAKNVTEVVKFAIRNGMI